jgi:hypothetical protein
MYHGQHGSCAGLEVGFEEIANDLLQARFWIVSGLPTSQESISLRAACPRWTTALKTEPVSAGCNLQL